MIEKLIADAAAEASHKAYGAERGLSGLLRVVDHVVNVVSSDALRERKAKLIRNLATSCKCRLACERRFCDKEMSKTKAAKEDKEDEVLGVKRLGAANFLVFARAFVFIACS